MRIHRFFVWLIVATLVAPPSTFAARTSPEIAMRIALSDAELASAQGGSVPTAKIGANENYGHVVVYRNINGTQFCGVQSEFSHPILPNTVARPPCPASIPTHAFVDSSVDVVIGGSAAAFQGSNPAFVIYVNGVEVPASQLGADFQQRCPQIGTAATSSGSSLTLHDCVFAQPPNTARIPTSFFHGGLNTITVAYRSSAPAYDKAGDDIDTRIVEFQ